MLEVRSFGKTREPAHARFLPPRSCAAARLDDKEIRGRWSPDSGLRYAVGSFDDPVAFPTRRQYRACSNINEMLSRRLGGQNPSTDPRRRSRNPTKHLIDWKRSTSCSDQDEVTRRAWVIGLRYENGHRLPRRDRQIAARDGGMGAGVSREGVQARSLCRWSEGTTVATKLTGRIKTEPHSCSSPSGAFHVSKASDLLPELQGRSCRSASNSGALDKEDFRRIPDGGPEASLIKQVTYRADADRGS